MATSDQWRLSRLTQIGLATALVAAMLDQAIKFWLLYSFDLAEKGIVWIMPGIGLVLTWNTGISYGLFQQSSELGQWVLLALKVVAIAVLSVWLLRAETQLIVVSLGLIIGGALGNGIDRLMHGAVVDYLLLRLSFSGWSFDWYVFNLADVAIVAGVVGLLYDSLIGGSAAKAP